MSQLVPVTETLDGADGPRAFEIFKLDPITSLTALDVVKNALAPVIGSALASLDGVDDLSSLLDGAGSVGKLAVPVERLLQGISMDRLRVLIDTFSPVTEVDGKRLRKEEFDLIFRGDLPLLFSWLKLCFQAEWGNVLGAIGSSGIKDAIAQARSVKRSPTTSEPDGQSST